MVEGRKHKAVGEVGPSQVPRPPESVRFPSQRVACTHPPAPPPSPRAGRGLLTGPTRNEAPKGGHTSGQGHSESCSWTEKPGHTPSLGGEPPRPTETPRASSMAGAMLPRGRGLAKSSWCSQKGHVPEQASPQSSVLRPDSCPPPWLPLHRPQGFPLQAPTQEACTQASPAWRSHHLQGPLVQSPRPPPLNSAVQRNVTCLHHRARHHPDLRLNLFPLAPCSPCPS